MLEMSRLNKDLDSDTELQAFLDTSLATLSEDITRREAKKLLKHCDDVMSVGGEYVSCYSRDCILLRIMFMHQKTHGLINEIFVMPQYFYTCTVLFALSLKEVEIFHTLKRDTCSRCCLKYNEIRGKGFYEGVCFADSQTSVSVYQNRGSGIP